jgi:hypothetical protein
MRKIIIFLTVWYAALFTGCSTPSQPGSIEDKAAYVGDWISQRSGLIQVAVQATTHVLIYSTAENSEERGEVLSRVHAVSDNLYALVSKESVDPKSVRDALKIKEDYADSIMETVANLYATEYETLKKNGYGSLAIEILKAVSKGVSDGSVQ